LGDPVNLTDPTGLNPLALALGASGYLGQRAAGWLPDYLARSPWAAGFADGLSHIPFTDTSLAGLMRDAAGVDDITDYCSHRYRAGYSMGQSTGLVIAGIGMIRAAIEMGALPAEAIFGHYGWGMASAGDVARALGAIKNAATIGSRFGREAGSRIGEAIVR
ncbi:MAG: hypothetical protein H6Q05_3912, partial [Acidobacteria bacterium]|nr:hypothetical protein [Acidobacteriota bacterium]